MVISHPVVREKGVDQSESHASTSHTKAPVVNTVGFLKKNDANLI